MRFHHILHIYNIVVEFAYQCSKFRDLSILSGLGRDIVIDNFLVILCEKPVHLTLLISQSLHIIASVFIFLE